MVKLQVGAVGVSSIAEIEYRKVDIPFLYNELTQDDMRRNSDWLDSDVIDVDAQTLGFAFRAYLVEIDDLKVLVDACNGNHKNRPTAKWQHDLGGTDFLDCLKAAGVSPADVDYVVCTHLHCDHVGWLTKLSDDCWVPTFTNAVHIFSRKEFDYYDERFGRLDTSAVNHGSFEDSVLPVIRECRHELVQNDKVIHDSPAGSIRLSPSPGHSIDHVSVVVRSQGEEVIICGDVVHHPIQLDMPLMPMRADLDPVRASESRMELLNHCAESGAWLAAGHFCKYPFVLIERHNDVFRIKGVPSGGGRPWSRLNEV